MLVVSAHLHGTLFTMQMNKKGSFQRAKGKMAASTCRGRTDWQEGIISTKPGLHVPNRWHAVRTQFQLFMLQLETDIQGFANLAQSPKIIKCHTWFNFPLQLFRKCMLRPLARSRHLALWVLFLPQLKSCRTSERSHRKWMDCFYFSLFFNHAECLENPLAPLSQGRMLLQVFCVTDMSWNDWPNKCSVLKFLYILVKKVDILKKKKKKR